MPTSATQSREFEARVQESFNRQKVMRTIGATLARVAAGEVEITLPFRDALTQQHGFIHAGIVSTIADNACGYAAYTLMPADAAVLTIEYKVNLVSPAVGDRLIARARVAKAGRTVTVCACDVFALLEGQEKMVATMLNTLMTVRDRPELKG